MVLAPSTGRAHIDIYFSPGPVQPAENVLFQDFRPQSGLTILGSTNQTHTTVFFDQPIAPETLITPSGGQARIEATDGSFNSLRTQFLDPDLGFTEFEANPNYAVSGQPILVRVVEANGEITDTTFVSKASGQNFFGVRATDGQVIKSVSFSIASGIGQVVLTEDARQIRIGGITAVPEASSLAMMGVVVTAAAAGGLVRRARKAVA
jgi:hypothetical protein